MNSINNLNSHRELVINANKNFYDEIALINNKTNSHIAKKDRREFYERLIEETLKNYNIKLKGSNVLELGCGSGSWHSFFFHHGVKKYEGVELLGKMIQEAQKTVLLTENATFFQGSAEQFVEDAQKTGKQFDYIISFSFLHHLVDPIAFLKQLESILSPKGVYLALHEVNQESPQTISKTLDTISVRIFGYDTIDTSFVSRILWLIDKFFKFFCPILFKNSINTEKEDFDWIEYQLNSKSFSPDKFPEHISNMKIEKVLYSYYVFKGIQRLPRSMKNMFYLVFRKFS